MADVQAVTEVGAQYKLGRPGSLTHKCKPGWGLCH